MLGLPPPVAPVLDLRRKSAWTRAQLDAVSELAQTSEVRVYVLDPCRELWDDVAGRGDQAWGLRPPASGDPLPLVLWGRPVRDAMAALIDRSAGDVDDCFVAPAADTALGRLLQDVMTRSGSGSDAGSGSGSDSEGGAGVQVLACANVRREVEVVADAIRARLDADSTLRAHDIAVWIAGDAEHRMSQAPSALEAVGVPCHLIDAPLDDRGRVAEAVLALLELPTSAMRRRDLLRVMTHPTVLAAYPHVDAADWVRWTERLGIAHGADASAHDGSYLAAHRDRFHWHQGVRRLALGAFMTGGRGATPVRLAGIEVAPEEVRADQQASAATYALLVRSLCADADWLAGHVATLTDWGAIFAGLVDALPDRARARTPARRGRASTTPRGATSGAQCARRSATSTSSTSTVARSGSARHRRWPRRGAAVEARAATAASRSPTA